MKQGGLRTRGIIKESTADSPLVSIVMVTWNASGHFRQALESVIQQDYQNKEIIVIDGGSTDGTLDIVLDFSNEIDFWISEPDQGIYDAMNKGVLLALGEWIGFKNADDWYSPEALTVLTNKAKAQPEVDVWYGNSYSVLQEDPLQLSPFYTNHEQLGGNPGIDHRCSFVRAERHKDCLFSLKYRLAADLDVFWRLKKAGCIFRHTGTFMAYKRFGGASDGTNILAESFRINQHHGGLFFALRLTLESRIRFLIWKTGNFLLRLFLSEKAYHHFKSRKLPKP